MLITGGFGWGKTNILIDLISQQDDIDKIYLYAKDLNEPKYECLTKKPYSFLTTDTTLSARVPLRFRKTFVSFL